MKATADTVFWLELNTQRPFLTKQQYSTLKGQAKKGNLLDARKGLKRIMARRRGK